MEEGGGGGRSKVRLTAGGAGGKEDGRRCGLRLPGVGCIDACKSSVSMSTYEPGHACRKTARCCSDWQNGVFIHHKGAVRGFVFIYAGLQSGKGVELLTIETGIARELCGGMATADHRQALRWRGGWSKTRLTVA